MSVEIQHLSKLLKSHELEKECEQSISSTDQSLPSHKLVYNDGFSNFELPLLVQNSTCAAQILCGLTVCLLEFGRVSSQ